MSKREIEDGLITALRTLPKGDKPHLGEIRRAIGCTVAELGDAVQRLRNQGKLAFDRLALSPSMLLDMPDTGSVTLPAATGSVAEAPAAVLRDGISPAVPTAVSGEDAGEGVRSSPAPVGPLDPASDGMVLLRAIETYCGAVGMTEPEFGKSLFGYPGFVGLLRKRGTVSPEKIIKVGQFLNDYPDGVADAAPTRAVTETAPASAPVLAKPRRVTKPAQPQPIKLSMVEALQSAIIDEPTDLLRVIGIMHNEMWQRCLVLGRTLGATPASTLYRALGAGLDLIEADLSEEAQHG